MLVQKLLQSLWNLRAVEAKDCFPLLRFSSELAPEELLIYIILQEENVSEHKVSSHLFVLYMCIQFVSSWDRRWQFVKVSSSGDTLHVRLGTREFCHYSMQL